MACSFRTLHEMIYSSVVIPLNRANVLSPLRTDGAFGNSNHHRTCDCEHISHNPGSEAGVIEPLGGTSTTLACVAVSSIVWVVILELQTCTCAIDM
ncbi:hypothetical protein SNOG_14650 [Parastagonospora nodorum SN15]|uniref:Uncharacterized protein n=1 Tax=Phaeosphaeria nodorum (strain SN15 / ATCC MYA-4574 / FGSC 10173) TaxID=321614 RepID=Q0U0E3_PHANO|nr:hypothetical protein SNOG_14650 [Parastagonospora nodorum SN15]EAT77842.1 hypothetical protein SNOG_14650 [Parastagonospora nodorum SN15]